MTTDVVLALLAVLTAVWNVSLIASTVRRARVASRTAHLHIQTSWPRIAVEMGRRRDIETEKPRPARGAPRSRRRTSGAPAAKPATEAGSRR